MKKFLIILFTGLLLAGCDGSMLYKGNYENLVVISVKKIYVPKTTSIEYKKEPICRYKVRNFDPNYNSSYSMTWNFVDRMGKYQVGDTIKFVKK